MPPPKASTLVSPQRNAYFYLKSSPLPHRLLRHLLPGFGRLRRCCAGVGVRDLHISMFFIRMANCVAGVGLREPQHVVLRYTRGTWPRVVADICVAGVALRPKSLQTTPTTKTLKLHFAWQAWDFVSCSISSHRHARHLALHFVWQAWDFVHIRPFRIVATNHLHTNDLGLPKSIPRAPALKSDDSLRNLH